MLASFYLLETVPHPTQAGTDRGTRPGSGPIVLAHAPDYQPRRNFSLNRTRRIPIWDESPPVCDETVNSSDRSRARRAGEFRPQPCSARPISAAFHPIWIAGFFPNCCAVSARGVWCANRLRLNGIACTVHSQSERTMLALSEESVCVLTGPPSYSPSRPCLNRPRLKFWRHWPIDKAGVNWIT